MKNREVLSKIIYKILKGVIFYIFREKMSEEEDENIQDLFSLQLVSQFRRKTSSSNISNLRLNDSLVAPSVIQENHEFVKRIYFTGTCPWEDEKTQPHLFFTIPFDQTLEDPISAFCFPHGGKITKKIIHSDAEFIQEALSKPDENSGDLEFFTLYFPIIEDAPYFYCCRFLGNLFSMPTISHELTLDDIFSLVNKGDVPCSEMCICVQSSYPDSNLYYGFLKWILQCERVGKFSITQATDMFLQDKLTDNEMKNFGAQWPEKHRDSLSALAAKIIFSEIPAPGDKLFVDKSPFPPFSWTREVTHKRKDFELCLSSMRTLISFTPLSIYMQLISALLLEKRIIVYSNSCSITTDIILAFHAMLYPMKWVAPSISILPDAATDIFDSPSSTMLGIDKPLKNPPDNTYYYDCDKREFKCPRQLHPFPHAMLLEERLKPLFVDPSGKEKEIIEMTNMAMKDILSPLRASIITDFSDPKKSGSRFMPELFLKNFPSESRLFVKSMLNTQMMQFHIELECRRCSAEFDEQAKLCNYKKV